MTGSPSRRRRFQLSKSPCTRRQARLTVSLLTAPPKSFPSAKRTRRVFTPTVNSFWRHPPFAAEGSIRPEPGRQDGAQRMPEEGGESSRS